MVILPEITAIPPETPPVWIGQSWEQVRPTGKHWEALDLKIKPHIHPLVMTNIAKENGP